MTFKPAARYPADPRVVFIFALICLTGVTSIALKAAPNTLEATMPQLAVTAWGILLTIGSLITLIGIAKDTLNGVLMEQIGSVIVGVTTTFYSAIAIKVVGMTGLQTISIIMALGLSCFLRWFQLQALINHAYKEQIRAEVSKTFMDDLDDLDESK